MLDEVQNLKGEGYIIHQKQTVASVNLMKPILITLFFSLSLTLSTHLHAHEEKKISGRLFQICQSFKTKVEEAKHSTEKKNPLAPSKYINQSLNEFVMLASETSLSKRETKTVLKQLSSQNCLKTLRELSMLSEEQMENKATDDFYAYYRAHPTKTRLPHDATLKEKLKVLKKMMLIPQGYQFQYLNNYISLVAHEVEMLNHLNRFKRQNDIEIGAFFKGDLPNLKGKHVTFVGSGFPLSGVAIHLLTHAKVNLVEIDKNATTRMQQFLTILDQAGVIDVKNFKVILGDGKKLTYTHAPRLKSEIKTNILFLAAALPNAVKESILKKIGESKNKNLIIIDRYVSGIFKIFYYGKIKSNAIPNFQTLAKIYPAPLAWKVYKKSYPWPVKLIDKMHQNSSRVLMLRQDIK